MHEKLLITDKNILWSSLNPTVDKDAESLLKGLSNCTVEHLDNGVTAFTLGGDALLPFNLKFGRNIIYSRPDYPSLLEKIRSLESVVLTSNPGIGKSMFQFYYLVRISNPELLRTQPLPPDSWGSTEPPEVVIQQVGDDRMFIYFIKAQRVYRIGSNRNVFDCFDPKTTLYLHEPEASRSEPMWGRVYCSIRSTVPPDTIRYKQFIKNGGVKLYMPLPTKSDSLSMGEHLRGYFFYYYYYHRYII